MNRLPPFALAVLLACPAFSRAADWPLFRGPDRSGIAPADAKPPLTWGAEKNVKWKAALPRPGNSSPIVVGDRVFVTSAEDAKGTRRSLYCFARADGRQLWVRTVPWEKFDPTHETNPYCAASPAADPATRRVVAWHGSAGLHCYDFDGNPAWSADLGTIRHIWGWASSPVIHGDAIYVNAGPGARQFVTAIGLKDGKARWQTDEPGGAEDKSAETGSWLGSWSTPVVTAVDGKPQVLVFMARRVNAYDPATGAILWTVGGAGVLAYNDVLISPERAGGRIAVAAAGYGGPAIGFKLGGTGDVTATNRLWASEGKPPPQRIGSGVIVGDHVYLPSEPHVSCIELKSGKEVWRQKIAGQVWGSIIAAGDRLYVTGKTGVTHVFAADPGGYRELASNDLGEPSNATPALTEGQIFLRSAKHLWCVEDK